jgi:hypothetical protein
VQRNGKAPNARVKNSTRRSLRTPSSPRHKTVLETAKAAGLLSGVSERIAGRIGKRLLQAAKARSGIKSNRDLLEYALACIALEDDFGKKLTAREGRLPSDLDLSALSV